MRCRECGTEFFEGVFCPECGAKYAEENNVIVNGTEEGLVKAQTILAEYDRVEEEKNRLKSINWPNSGEAKKRIRERIEAVKEARNLGLKSEYAQNEISKMCIEIRQDYSKIQRETKEGNSQIIWAIALTIVSLTILFSLGIIGKIVGVIIILSQWNAVYEHEKDKKLVIELDEILKKENIC